MSSNLRVAAAAGGLAGVPIVAISRARHAAGGVGPRAARAKFVYAMVCATCMATASGAPVNEPVHAFAATVVRPILPPVGRRGDTALVSVVFDAPAAALARERMQPVYVESLVVEGRDPDARQRKFIPLEIRFAQALLAPPVTGAVGLRALDTTPCCRCRRRGTASAIRMRRWPDAPDVARKPAA